MTKYFKFIADWKDQIIDLLSIVLRNFFFLFFWEIGFQMIEFFDIWIIITSHRLLFLIPYKKKAIIFLWNYFAILSNELKTNKRNLFFFFQIFSSQPPSHFDETKSNSVYLIFTRNSSRREIDQHQHYYQVEEKKIWTK